MSVINTTKGLYRVTRFQMGMKNAASIFQNVMETVLQGLVGCICYQDDILVHAETEASLQKRLNAVKSRISEKGLTVNADKCIDSASSITFLGFKLSRHGIQPSDELTKKFSTSSG